MQETHKTNQTKGKSYYAVFVSVNQIRNEDKSYMTWLTSLS